MSATRRLLAVFAHPDDESLACGGTLARCADAGIEITLVCATRGEAGSINPLIDVARESLGDVREAEVRQAARVLGIRGVVVLHHKDGLLPWTDPRVVERDLAEVFDRVTPDAVLTFGADGLYWHPDHIAISARTAAVVRERASTRPVVLYEVTMPASAMTGLGAALEGRTGAGPLAPWGLDPAAFGRGALPPTIVVDVSAQIDRKLAALACHRSQLGPDNPLAHLDRDLALKHLGAEHFHVAPGSPLGRGMLEDVAAESDVDAARGGDD